MGTTQQMRKQTKTVDYDIDESDAMYDSRPPCSTRKYSQPVEHDTLDDFEVQQETLIARRRSSLKPEESNRVASKAVSSPLKVESKGIAPRVISSSLKKGVQKSKHFPWLVLLAGMLVMALLGMALINLGTWWRIHQDDVQYGRPRTFQVDTVVGHNDSKNNPTHIICINLNRHVQIIELPGGDASHARIYTGPVLFGDGQDLTPVTAEIRDVNNDGKLDMVVHIQDQQLLFLNDGTQFHLQQQPGGH